MGPMMDDHTFTVSVAMFVKQEVKKIFPEKSDIKERFNKFAEAAVKNRVMVDGLPTK